MIPEVLGSQQKWGCRNKSDFKKTDFPELDGGGKCFPQLQLRKYKASSWVNLLLKWEREGASVY